MSLRAYKTHIEANFDAKLQHFVKFMKSSSEVDLEKLVLDKDFPGDDLPTEQIQVPQESLSEKNRILQAKVDDLQTKLAQ